MDSYTNFHTLRFHLRPRMLTRGVDGLRTFQREALRAIVSGSKPLVVVHAPVGAGKSYIVCELLRQMALRSERGHFRTVGRSS